MLRLAPRALLASFAVPLAMLCAAGAAHAAVPQTPYGGQRARVQQGATIPPDASLGGEITPSSPVQVTVALAPTDSDGLAAYAQDVSDPSSAQYRRYLTVAEFAARFGAGAASVASVRSALTQSGLTVGSLSANGLSLTASGTAGEVESAFGTELEQVSLPNGNSAYADVQDPTLPSRAAAAVQAVAGLSTLPVASPEGLAHLRSQTASAHASVAATASGSAPSACTSETTSESALDSEEGIESYTASEIGSAYGLSGEWSDGDLGAGETVALAEFESYAASDVNHYQSCNGTSATIDNVPVDGGDTACTRQQITNDDCGLEDVLDIEDLAGLLPDASIDVYEAPNTPQGLYDMYQEIVSSGDQVASTSWGECEADQDASEVADTSVISAENTLFEEAATAGQTVFAAAGDEGADDCETDTSNPQFRAVDDPASQPYVTGVGGTTMSSDVPGSTETVWDDSSVGAGGGGVSTEWATPSWQTAVPQGSDVAHSGEAVISCETTPGSSTTSTSCREVPDVSADADPDSGYDVYWDGSWTVVGGTSAAAPTWASLVALANASSTCTGDETQVGFANPLLYQLATADPADFNDVTSGDNSYGGVYGYKALSGYDMASGLGAPDGAALIPALCAATTTPAGGNGTDTTTTVTTTTTATTPVQTDTTPVQTATTPTTTTTTTTGLAPPVVRFVTYRARRTVRVGRSVRFALRARDRNGLRLRYSARRLPRGLRINPATGVITGRPKHAGRSVSSITARDSHGDSETIVVRWTVRRA